MEYEHYWLDQLNATRSISKGRGGNKLRTYKLLKQQFTIEPYLLHIDNTVHRKTLTQLRLSAHNLNIESMRPTTPDPKLRLCSLCTNKQVEDEEHFLVRCPTYETHRTELLNTCLTLCPMLAQLNMSEKFMWLMTNENKPALKALGKFVWQALETRKHKLQTTDTPQSV
jgi:hypothetical protein